MWLFTFAGAGNSHYAEYITEMYCNITFEYPERAVKALFNNWLVNMRGLPGHFHEIDLLQEHNNKFMEELAQLKGKEFDDPWFRDVISRHVHHFLYIIEEMEANVSLKSRTRKHKEPHLDNELREVMRICRDHDLHRHRASRDFGFHAEDDFGTGYKVLDHDGKLQVYARKGTKEVENREVELGFPGAGDHVAHYLHE